MTEQFFPSKSEPIGINDLQSEFLSLRIGEKIPCLEIKGIRKLTNPLKEDNLPGTDYKYLIESEDSKILTVNSWVLWKEITSVLKEAGKINVKLVLKHNGREDYSVKLI